MCPFDKKHTYTDTGVSSLQPQFQVNPTIRTKPCPSYFVNGIMSDWPLGSVGIKTQEGLLLQTVFLLQGIAVYSPSRKQCRNPLCRELAS